MSCSTGASASRADGAAPALAPDPGGATLGESRRIRGARLSPAQAGSARRGRPHAEPTGGLMDKDIFKERGRSLEEEYFKKHEAKLVERLRERAQLDAIAEALAVNLHIDHPELLRRIIAPGVTSDTGASRPRAPHLQA